MQNPEALRSLIKWQAQYRPEWDNSPDEYATQGAVQWGRSRRLGLFQLGNVKAYVGVQHVDPNKPGWDIVREPHVRFFLSLFVSGECITLRTFPNMDTALEMLAEFLRSN